MDEWEWHDVLYALWCLGDVERVEDLEARIERVSVASMTPLSQGGVKNLNNERHAVMAELKRKQRGDEMPVAVLLTFPGFPNYRKGPVS